MNQLVGRRIQYSIEELAFASQSGLLGAESFLSDFDGMATEVYVHDGGQVVFGFRADYWGTPPDLEASDLSHRYLWGPAVDQLIADEFVFDLEDAEENETLWALTDKQGSVTDMVDNNGTQRLHRVFDSYGNILSETHFDDEGEEVSSIDPGYLDEAFAYTGRLLDKDTGQQYNHHRWYDAAIGQWASEDPIGFNAGDANLYRYVGNSPTNFVDPTGLKHDTAKEKGGDTLECIRSAIPQCGFEVTYSDGSSQTGKTSDGLRKAMYRLPRGCITAIIIKGHGANDPALISNDDGTDILIQTTPGGRILIGPEDVTDDIKDRMGPNASVSMRACHSDKLAKDVANIIGKGVTVSGVEGSPIGIPFTRWMIGPWKNYLKEPK